MSVMLRVIFFITHIAFKTDYQINIFFFYRSYRSYHILRHHIRGSPNACGSTEHNPKGFSGFYVQLFAHISNL